MQPVPPCPALARWWLTWESGLLLCWQLQLGMYSVFFFFFSPGYVALWDSKTPHRPTCERVSYCVETSLPSWLPPQDGSLSLNLLSLFLSFIFCPTSLGREWAALLRAWCPLPVFRSHFVEVISIQMIFWWICEGESGLPILFLHHHRTAPFYWQSSFIQPIVSHNILCI